MCQGTADYREMDSEDVYGAGDGIRTRDINLGKVALYQLSYSREPVEGTSKNIVPRGAPHVKLPLTWA